MKKNFQEIIFYFMLGITILLFVFVPKFFRGENLSFDTEKVTPLNQGWVWEKADGETSIGSLPVKLPVGAGEHWSVYMILTDDFKKEKTLAIRNPHQAIEVFLNDRKIYERGMEPWLYLGNSPGSSWNLVSIPKDSEGGRLTLSITSPYGAYAGITNEVYYGSRSGVYYWIARSCIAPFLMAVILLIVGIFLLGIHFIVGRMKEHRKVLLYLSWFSILGSLWMLGETRMLQFFTGNQFFITQLSVVSAMLFPVPMIFYIEQFLCRRHLWIPRILTALFAINFIWNIGLQLAGAADFYETVFLTQGCMGIMILALTITLAAEVVKDKNKRAQKMAFPIFTLFGFGLLELIFFYLDRGTVTTFSCMGVFLFIIILSIQSLKDIGIVNEKIQKIRYYEELAYEDLLTGAKNRNAYFQRAEELYREKSKLKNRRILLFDLNDLKKINDNFGHIKGDQALVRSYGCILKAFGQRGECYRIGGDEFACILEACTDEEFDLALECFRKEVGLMAKRVEYRFQIALGYACYQEDTDTAFELWANRADQMLYENKRHLKNSDMSSIQ